MSAGRLATLVFIALGAAAQEPAAPRFNAALPTLGATVSVQPGPNVYLNPGTPPESIADGDRHSRVVFTGAPYTYRFELVRALPLTAIGFAHTDIASETTAHELQVRLEGGATFDFTLGARPDPAPRGLVYEEFALGGPPTSWVEVTVKTIYPGANDWGGLGEIALFTSVDLPTELRAPGWDAAAPVFVRVPPFDSAAPAEVHLPPRVAPGVWPRSILGPTELAQLRADRDLPRAAPPYRLLIGNADAAAARTPDFPDPAGPGGQLADRDDAISRRHDLIGKETGTLGLAFAMTGEERYAQAARVRLLGYAERYAQYPLHTGANRNDAAKVMAQRLSEAMWLVPQLSAYDYLHDWLTPADRATIETGLIRPAVEMIRRAVPAAEVAERTARDADWRTRDPYTGESKVLGNWTNFYALATILAGATLEDQDLIDLAAAELRANIAEGIGADGMWGEGAIGYQLFALQAMLPAVDIAARCGIDLYSYRDSRLKQLFDSPLRYAYPDGTMAGIHDSGRATLGDWSTMVYDYAWQAWRDPRYAALVNRSPRQMHVSEGVYFPARVYEPLPEPPSVHYPSTIFGNLGFALARDTTKFALLDYGRHGGVHGHLDKLNLILFSGDELGGEPGFHRYEDSLHAQWTTQTVAHNTVTVNERSQQVTEGRLLCFDADDQRIIMRAESAEAYPGVLLDRTVVVLPDAVVDLFRVSAGREVKADLTLRYAGTLPYPPFPTFAPVEPLGTRDGYQHLRPTRSEDGAATTERIWQTKAGELHAQIVGVPGQNLTQATGPDDDQILLLRQAGQQLDFAVIYQMDAWGAAVTAARLLDPSAAGVGVEWTQGGAARRVRVNHNRATFSAEAASVVLEP